MNTQTRTAFALLMIVAASVAQTVEGELDQARSLAQANKIAEAGKAFGRAAAVAQKANDVLAEQKVADQMADTLFATPSPQAEALAAVLSSLDAKRAGAFVSASAIATELLLMATRSGEFKHAAEAARVLAAQSSTPKCGKAVRALASYAKGLELVAGGKAGDALAPLQEALTASTAEGWIDVGYHAGTELAAQAVAAGKTDLAANTIAAVATLFPMGTDPDHVQNWRKLMKSRLKDCPPEVSAAFDYAMKAFPGGTSVSSAGGSGGRGAPPGGTRLCKAWDKLPSDKAFVSVKRFNDGFETTLVFEPGAKPAWQALKPGLKHWSDGGVALSFNGRGVALGVLDLIGNARERGEASALPHGTPLYRLAKGETWSVNKQGIVSITSN